MTRIYQTWHGFTLVTDTEMPARMVKIMDANDPDNWETTRILYNVGPSYREPTEAARLLAEVQRDRGKHVTEKTPTPPPLSPTHGRNDKPDPHR